MQPVNDGMSKEENWNLRTYFHAILNSLKQRHVQYFLVSSINFIFIIFDDDSRSSIGILHSCRHLEKFKQIDYLVLKQFDEKPIELLNLIIQEFAFIDNS